MVDISLLDAENIQVVVLMGGLGTRLGKLTEHLPKPLMPVCGRPFFEYQLDLLKLAGFKNFVFLVGYHAESIEEHFGDGSVFGMNIRYSYDGEKLLGTGGAIRKALPLLQENFLVIYGDSFIDADFEEILYRYARAKSDGQKALMTVLENNNSYDISNVNYRNGLILEYNKKNPKTDMRFVDYGISLFSKELFSSYAESEPFDLSDLQHELSLMHKLGSCEMTNRYYEIGTPDSLNGFTEYARHRFYESHPAVFLDRDGVINRIVFNEETEQLDSPLNTAQFELLPGVIQALRTIQEKGFYIFIASNQPAAAKGKTSLASLYDINCFFLKQLKTQDIKISDSFICPHHPKGTEYSKEPFLIKDCSCRKPQTGLIIKALQKYKIVTEHSFMVGDSYTDIQAGRSAGLNTVFLGDFKCDSCRRLQFCKPELIEKDLLSFSCDLNSEKSL